MKRLNKRRHDRLPASEAVALRWREESGEARFHRGTVLDYTENGLRVEMLEPIEFPSDVVLLYLL